MTTSRVGIFSLAIEPENRGASRLPISGVVCLHRVQDYSDKREIIMMSRAMSRSADLLKGRRSTETGDHRSRALESNQALRE